MSAALGTPFQAACALHGALLSRRLTAPGSAPRRAVRGGHVLGFLDTRGPCGLVRVGATGAMTLEVLGADGHHLPPRRYVGDCALDRLMEALMVPGEARPEERLPPASDTLSIHRADFARGARLGLYVPGAAAVLAGSRRCEPLVHLALLADLHRGGGVREAGSLLCGAAASAGLRRAPAAAAITCPRCLAAAGLGALAQ
ncbi:hypothetical protein J2T57_001726 [Natronocella acetinitrilica]|uniref:Uncharacterized protein n=1 Tax=Natronocella acetinitrilica TaxID=414046 RepID=A0AAE3G3W7_9GAMM|nr:hypothetical protein [Natronocella acetinitrilica]MCP1674624.1 hypothetical protein [Natronocella acetinitrilica]